MQFRESIIRRDGIFGAEWRSNAEWWAVPTLQGGIR